MGLMIKLGRKLFGGGNSFEPLNAVQSKSGDGLTFVSNIKFGEKYPNSYLDIYSTDGDFSVKRPVFIFLHGGGYTWGDKFVGDPFAQSNGRGFIDYFKPFLGLGVRVVSVNYALAPEYLYPVPVYQIDEAVRFLQERGKEYGIDMERVIFGGGSAGGHLVGQYINVQTNVVYAKEMRMSQNLKSEHIKAAVFASALFDLARFDKTGSAIDWLFRLCARTYCGRKDYSVCDIAKQSNVMNYVTKDFPPSFISDGNKDTFTDQATELAAVLKRLGVRHELLLHPLSEVKLGHGYETDLNNEHAIATSKRVVAFLKEVGV